jgi:hypothetical protein
MRRGYAPLAVPLVAGALAIVWWAPWSSAPDPVVQARAAFGDLPVVHVLARPTTLRSASPLRALMTVQETEIWYDRSRDREHVVEEHNGVVKAESVGAPEPETTPTLSFVMRYPSDLADRRLHVAGRDVIQNRPVIWLRSSAYEVAIDPVSYRPLWVATSKPSLGTPLVQLVTAETKPYDPADFLTAKQRKPRHL